MIISALSTIFDYCFVELSPNIPHKYKKISDEILTRPIFLPRIFVRDYVGGEKYNI